MPEGKRFKPGNAGGPGRPPMPEDIRKIKVLTKSHVEKVMNLFAGMTEEQIEVHLKRPETTMLEHMVGQITLRAVRDGDTQRLNFLLDRTIGKVKEVTEIQLPVPTIIERLNGDQIELGAKVIDAEVLEGEK